MSIRINATVNEARAAAGHNKEQWDRFYFITKDEAKQLSETHTDWTRWILIPANEKENMLDRINGRLAAEGIPSVEMIILKWRMSQLLRDIQRKYRTFDAEGSMTSGMYSSITGSQTQIEAQPGIDMQQQSPVNQPLELSPSPNDTRPYDPIRDV
ncbi:hypothetical protein B0J11DRAFT_552725 [Dendryphion nanum]|uniref:Uncharacterized protein n=1 Tax=Dendryphion nanum TaxID=256645 RepID=A0A9P9DCP4_9PLEO|nr:hypothetical protein B0J11DRAFT_552725 [Dendryphion nanum]